MTGRGQRLLGLLVTAGCLALPGVAAAGPIVSFGTAASTTLPANPSTVVTADFNQDGDPDLAVANDASNNVSILLGGAGGSFSGPTNIAVPGGATGLAVGNFNSDADTDPDLAVVGTSGSVSVLLGDTGATFLTGQTLTAGSFPVAAAVADLNGDGDPEIVVANQNGDNLSVFTGAVAGRFIATPTIIATGDAPDAIAVGDFNGDGDPDLAVTNRGQLSAPAADSVGIYTGTTGVGFTASGTFTVGDFPSGVATADFNGDGDPDLAVTNETASTVSILTGSGTGAGFTAAGTLSGGGRAVAIGDFNKDGDPDLAVGGNAADNVSVFTGGAGATFGTAQLFALGGTVLSVAVADFNGDKLPDVAGANYFDATATTALNTTDLVPPDTSITAGPAGPTNDRTPDFFFTSTEPGSTFACRVVGVTAFAACTSPFTSPALADGAATFEVRATDAAGNVDATPASRSFTLDTIAPDATILTGPTGTTDDDTPTFTFSSGDTGAVFSCRIDAGAGGVCTSPFTTTPLADGPHTLTLLASDAAGNVSSPATRAFSVAKTPPVTPTPTPTPTVAPTVTPTPDTTAPDTVITTGPSGPTTSRNPTFTFTSSEAGSTFECKLDALPFSACTSPHTLPELTVGPHTFQVRAVDPSGNVDPSPATQVNGSTVAGFSVVAAPLPAPVLGKEFNAVPIAGKVFVSVPAGAARASQATTTVPGLKGQSFIPLEEARQLPVGTFFDTRRGTVDLTLATATSGVTQTGRFDGGVFRTLQSPAKLRKGLTVLRLKGQSFANCPTRLRGRRAAIATNPKKIKRLLHARDSHGKFRTRGRFSSATVRGTKWTTADRCDGTLTKVKRGIVDVRDFTRRKTITVRAGHRYLAKRPLRGR